MEEPFHMYSDRFGEIGSMTNYLSMKMITTTDPGQTGY